MTTTLLPCPFCGGPALFYSAERRKSLSGIDDACIDCDACEASLYAATDDEAVRRWNRRAPDPEHRG